MDTPKAVADFTGMLRIGTEALRDLLANDTSIRSNLEPDINHLLSLIDSMEEVGKTIERKAKSPRRGESA